MRTPYLRILLALLLAGFALGVVYYLGKGPPPANRLLPEADAIAYVNLKPIRLATHFDPRPIISREPEYEDFVRRTRFEFERDLDEVALAVHRSGEGIGDTRYSEILVGHMDRKLLSDYLQSIAKTIEHYRSDDIFLIPHEGRTVRVAILSADTVAVSNTTGDINIHTMIDHYHHPHLPFGGPGLLRRYYKEIPLASIAWAIVKLGNLSDEKSIAIPLPGGFNVVIPGQAVLVTSIRYRGDLHLKAEAITESEDQARRISDHINTLLGIYNKLSGTTDPDLKKFFGSITVEHRAQRAVLTARLPQAVLAKLISDAPIPPPALQKK